ncbi:MAG: hypothetical protein AB7U73_09300 [Pirellulales bacterium]
MSAARGRRDAESFLWRRTPMSGPIVRSGASPEFSKNWDNIFGKPAKGKSGAGKVKKNAAGKKGGAAPAKASVAKASKTKPAAKQTATKKSKRAKAGKK